MFKWLHKRDPGGRSLPLWRKGEDAQVLQRRMILAARKLQQAQLAMGSDLAQLQELHGLLSDSDGRLGRLEAGFSSTSEAVAELGKRLERHEETLRATADGPGASELFAQSEARLDEVVAGLRELMEERPSAARATELERLLAEQAARLQSLEVEKEELQERMGSSAGGHEDELAERERQVADLEAARVELESSLDQLRLTLETYELEFRERELSASPSEAGDSEERVRELKEELARREERIGSLQRELARLEGSVRSLEITIDGQAQELREAGLGAESGKRGAELSADFARERDRAAELESAVKRLRQDLEAKETELREAAEARDGMDRLRGDLEARARRVEELDARNAELERALADLRRTVEEGQGRGGAQDQEELQAELTRHRERVAKLEARSSELENVLREGERERIDLETRHVQDMIEIADQTSQRIAELERELHQREARIRSLQSRSDPAEEGGSPSLTQLMQPEPGASAPPAAPVEDPAPQAELD